MVAAVTVQAPQAGVPVVYGAVTTSIDAPQGFVSGVYNVPAHSIESAQAAVTATFRQPAQGMPVTQGWVMAVVRGRTAQPHLVAWTFTLDSHDFYALRLGDDITLVYDQNTQQWAEWGEDTTSLGVTNTTDRWYLSTGLNWQGMGAYANTMGSDVVAGDDTYGAVYVLDPAEDEDYKPSTAASAPFTRIAQGQLLMTGRDNVPIWGVQLSGSVGEQWTGDLVDVELQSSDDMGNSYFSHGVLSITQGSYSYRLDWNSLGSMTNPGRLFKVIDNGALVRLDALDAYDRDSQ